MAIVYLGIGTNLGNREKNIKTALKLLKGKDVKVNKIYSFFKTKPEDGVNGSYFLNGVAEIETNLKAGALLTFLKSVESDLGRKKNHRKEDARSIDLDIIFYDSLILNDKNLIIPHPKFRKRKFVLEPLNEIASNFKDPVTGKSVGELLHPHLSPLSHPPDGSPSLRGKMEEKGIL